MNSCHRVRISNGDWTINIHHACMCNMARSGFVSKRDMDSHFTIFWLWKMMTTDWMFGSLTQALDDKMIHEGRGHMNIMYYMYIHIYIYQLKAWNQRRYSTNNVMGHRANQHGKCWRPSHFKGLLLGIQWDFLGFGLVIDDVHHRFITATVSIRWKNMDMGQNQA
jgi:hypothetical protein